MTSASRLAEEPLEPASPLGADLPATGRNHDATSLPLPIQSPSLLATIDERTPPNVAAATRLADEGRMRIAAGDYNTALEQLERAIAIDPSNAYAYYFLAEVHLVRGTYDQALVFADRAALLSEESDRNWLSRTYGLQGKVFEVAGRFADARVAYQRAVQTDPRNLPAQVGLSRVGRGAGITP